MGNREVAIKRLNDWLRGRPPQPEATSLFKVRKKKKEEETPSIICDPAYGWRGIERIGF